MTKTLSILAAAAATFIAGHAAAAPGFGNVNGVEYEQVRFYTPSSAHWPTTLGMLGTDYCAGVDRCGEPMTFASTYGGLITATASDALDKHNGIVIQDLKPEWGGLGVLSRRDRDGKLVGEDGINKGDTLTLTFTHQVTLVGLHFFDTDHTSTDRGDRGTLSIDGGAAHSLALNSYVTSNPTHWLTGSSFAFGYGWDNDDPKGYYLGAVKVMAPVPEPQTYALMLAGIGAVFMVSRRRRRG